MPVYNVQFKPMWIRLSNDSRKPMRPPDYRQKFETRQKAGIKKDVLSPSWSI